MSTPRCPDCGYNLMKFEDGVWYCGHRGCEPPVSGSGKANQMKISIHNFKSQAAGAQGSWLDVEKLEIEGTEEAVDRVLRDLRIRK